MAARSKHTGGMPTCRDQIKLRMGKPDARIEAA